MVRVKSILFFLFVCATSLFSQTDKEFWFVAPEVTTDHYDNKPCGEYPGTCRGGEPTLLRISTSDVPADVTIEQPANSINFPPINLNIPANSTQTISFTALGLQDEVEHIYESLDGVSGKSDKGLHVTSNSLITAYYEVRTKNNPDIWALKGENALGTEFYVPFQNKSTNQKSSWTTKAYHAIDIVATEDNTIIEITPTKDVYPGRTAGNTFTVTLDRGETFSVVPEYDAGDNAFDRAASAHMSGTHIKVTNGKKIAVSNKDDSVKHPGFGCYDLQGDQLVPVDVLGYEYIAMRGFLNDPIENLYIIGTQDNTNLWFNGNVGVPDAVIDEGETYIYEINSGTDYVHVRGDEKTLVWHVSGWGCEQGGAILPPTDKCTGSGQVAFTRSTSEEFFINIMVRAGAEDGFEMNGVPQDGGAGTLFGPGDFINVAGTADWTIARIGPVDATDIPTGVQTLVKNNKDIFHLGVINGSTNGGTRYGYFSDFNEVKVTSFTAETSSPFYRGCAGESIQLIAKGGTSYEWKPATYLDDPYSPTPISNPTESMIYTVVVSGACDVKDSATVQVGLSYFIDADFSMTKTVGCAPIDVEFSASFEGIKEVRWDFGNGNENWVFPDSTTFDSTFTRTFQNETDSAVIYPITLTIFNKEDCYDTITRYLVVNPRVTADFSTSDSIGCAPMDIGFTNLSDGDTNNFEWTFGDNGSSNLSNPTHNYLNNTRKDTSYNIRMIAVSPNLCRDTAYDTVTIHPYIETGFTIDTTFGCAQFQAILKNTSYHVDSFYLDWGDNSDTSMYGWSQVIHQYQNGDTLPHDTTIYLYGYNEEGCKDSISRNVLVSPVVNSDFTMDIDKGCDSFPRKFYK